MNIIHYDYAIVLAARIYCQAAVDYAASVERGRRDAELRAWLVESSSFGDGVRLVRRIERSRRARATIAREYTRYLAGKRNGMAAQSAACG